MDKIKVVHDAKGHTLTVWFDDPAKEPICEETADEVVLMKDSTGEIIGFGMMHYNPGAGIPSLTVETIVVGGE